MQGVALFGVGQDPRPGIIQQHQVELLRTVAFALLPGSGVKRIITGHRLAGAGGRQHRQQDREVVEMVHDLLDARKRDMDAGQGGRQARVAFVLGDRDLAGLGDEEVGSRDPDVGVDVQLPQVAAGDHRQLLRAVGRRRAEVLGEELADGLALHVHAREDEVVGGFAAELLDEFAEVALDHAVAGLLEGVVQVDLLRSHALGLHDGLGLVVLGDLQDDGAGFGRVAGPVDHAAVAFKVTDELLEDVGKVVDRGPLGHRGGVPGAFPVTVAGLLEVAVGVVTAERLTDECALVSVGRVDRGVLEEDGFGVVHGQASLARTSAMCSGRIGLPSRESQPPICRRHEGSEETT